MLMRRWFLVVFFSFVLSCQGYEEAQMGNKGFAKYEKKEEVAKEEKEEVKIDEGLEVPATEEAIAKEEPIPETKPAIVGAGSKPANKSTINAGAGLEPASTIEMSWQEVLTPLLGPSGRMNLDGNILKVELKNQNPLSENQFAVHLLGLANKAYELNPPFKIIMVEGWSVDATKISARIYLADVKEFLDQRISQPELIRRFGIEVRETVTSLKAKIKVFRAQGNFEESRINLKKWLALEPHSVMALSLLGNVNRDDKKYWDAIDAYKKIIEINSNSLFAFHNLGFCYAKVGAYDEAAKAYGQALSLYPKGIFLIKQLAETYARLGDFNGAMVWINKGREVEAHSDFWLIEGNLYRDQKKYQEAKLAYQKAMEMAPTDPKILFNLILVELENKAYEDAKKHYADLKQKEATYASELAVVSLFKEAPVDQPPSVKKDIPVVPAPAPEATPESSSDGVLEETHAY